MRYTHTRIVTFERHPSTDGSPTDILLGGTRTITLKDKVRYFALRKVVYEDVTPVYSLPEMGERKYERLEELYKDYPSSRDTIILDNDHYLKIYEPIKERS